MAKSVQSRLDKFMNGLKRHNPGEHEFHQAVYEVAVDIIPFSSRFNPEHFEIFSLRTDV